MGFTLLLANRRRSDPPQKADPTSSRAEGGEVEDDLRLDAGFLALNGGESAKELVADVGEDGGTACGDAVLAEEIEKAGEKVVDVVEFVHFGGIAKELGGDVGRLEIFGKLGVARAKARVGGGGFEAATSLIGEAVLTALFVFGGRGLGSGMAGRCGFVYDGWFGGCLVFVDPDLWVHFDPLFEFWNLGLRKNTPGVWNELKIRELREKAFVRD